MFAAILSTLAQETEWVCPMDPEIRAKGPGKCSRCGMDLAPGIPDQSEYGVDLAVTPAALKAGNSVELAFTIRDPGTGRQVKDFQIVHERLFHMFIVSQDLGYFVHEHPELGADAIFRFKTTFPKAGMYRVLSDFYPKGGAPQMIARTVIVPGAAITAGARLEPDVTPKSSENLTATLTTEPRKAIAGMRTLLFFDLEPADGLEPYLGAWGHLMAASEDLVDMIHTHPFIADGGRRVQFNVIFPRPGVYRVWVQFQRRGLVNTFAFTVPVLELGGE